MKLVFFDDYKLGLLEGTSVFDVTGAISELRICSPQEKMNRVIADYAKVQSKIQDAKKATQGIPLAQVKLRPPLPKPCSIVAMVRNYMESGKVKKIPEIDAFFKSSHSVIGPGETIVLPECKAAIFEHEAELGVVIGKTSKKVSRKNAFDHIFGYVNFIDVSARGFRPNGERSFFWGKCWDTFSPMGPVLVTKDEIPDPENLAVRLWVSGTLRQDYSTSDMAYKIPEVIEWVTSVTALEPGDVIAMGTNHQDLGPLQDADAVEMEIDGLGKLALHVRDEQKRSWPRLTRRQKEAQSSASASPARK